jgi:nitroreductase
MTGEVMHETIQSLRARRSIRRFKPEQVRDNELDAVPQAGMHALSGADRTT